MTKTTPEASVVLAQKLQEVLAGNKMSDCILALNTVLATAIVKVPGTTDADINSFLSRQQKALASTIKVLRERGLS